MGRRHRAYVGHLDRNFTAFVGVRIGLMELGAGSCCTTVWELGVSRAGNYRSEAAMVAKECERADVSNFELPNFEYGWAVLDRWRVGTLTNINDRFRSPSSCSIVRQPGWKKIG